ncbi:hypothetical protein PQD13_gp38 [Gordonia phage Clawz]|uniref:Uncharacterized protein n=1 Tax=Gordonia phage Clawz TaxID=2743910 RepID=A0AAE7FAE8_9CAUD|nr:hypothetical protein PQD13_gp38 [Gordonia phage Clawz]QKY79950.1 hypothetical protein SEA_CLAWZ_38 [Gordonia phage Clawz]
MSTALHLAIEDQDYLDGQWKTLNRERHMNDASEETLKVALRQIFQRESDSASKDTVQVRSVVLDATGSLVTAHNRTAKQRTLWYIGEE